MLVEELGLTILRGAKADASHSTDAFASPFRRTSFGKSDRG
jgi:hypothetical protein